MVGERTHDWTRRARGDKKKMVTQFFMAMRPPTCTAQEKQVREQALMRVDALLRRIQSHLEDGPETAPAAAADASPDRR